MKLGEMLLNAGCITELQLKTALAEQGRWGGKLGKILVDMNYVSEDLVIKALCKQLNVPRARLDAPQVPAQILARVDRAFCEANLCVPFSWSNGDRTLHVAVSDPGNVRLLDELRQRSGARIQPALEGNKAIALAIGRLFHSELLEDSSADDLKLVGNSGATLLRKISDIKPPPAPAPARTAPPPPAAPPPAAPPPAAAAEASATDLVRLQKRQSKALRVLVELLVEKGAFSREDFVAWLQRRPG